MAGTVHVLAILGDGPVADAVASELADGGARIDLTVASTVERGLDRVRSGDVDCVLVGAAVLADDAGLLDRLASADPALPVLVALGESAALTPAEWLERGATDYVQLSGTTADRDVLATRVEGAARASRARVGTDTDAGRDADGEETTDSGTDGEAAGDSETAEGRRVPIDSEMTNIAALTRGELERRVREYDSIIRAIPDEIAIISDEGYMIDVIPPTDQELTTAGYHPDELRGEPITLTLPDDTIERAWSVLDELATSDRERGTFEMELETKDGRRLLREGHMALLENAHGSINGSVTVLRDIGERKAYERKLERQNERLEQFASITSHDLRNPLNVAQGYLELVAEDCASAHTGSVADALDRMERLIDDTLTWARQGERIDERERIDLASLAPECWASVGGDDGNLSVCEPVTVHGDTDRLRRLLENLLRNAVEHGGPDVTVEIGPIGAEGDREDGDGESVAGFYVADDGPGIPPADREAVFDAGVTTASEGTGFGLAIIAEIVEAHGWEIAVTESEAGGARFEITGVGDPG